ncbi:MAG TPA: NPCBM/NEW2 domain-containing protein [Rhodocyclaceae bacterium]|nr:NPCBM/NEW2 domain-containing protein [Rhodocyclaceae bacterium]
MSSKLQITANENKNRSASENGPEPSSFMTPTYTVGLNGTFRPLGAWILLAVVLNILLATANGLAGDLTFWVDWSRHLTTTGYANLVANYPPLLMHWLWLIGKFEALFRLAPAPDLLMRFLVNTPVLLAHVALVALLARVLRQKNVTDKQWNMLIGFAALNPALLIDGPIWGQVDVVFCLFVALVLWLLIEGRFLLWVLPLFALAVLTKFQTICVAPVVLPLLRHRRSKALFIGVLPAIAIIALLLLPYWLVGATSSMIDQAYLKASTLYPYATLHADNLWYLLDLDLAHDGTYIFDHLHSAESWQKFFTVKPFGIFLFGAWSLMLLVSSWRVDDTDRHWRNATLCALGFFVWLPGMHERYLLPAVVLALLATAHNWRFFVIAVVLTGITAINLLFIEYLAGGLLPYLVAGCAVLYSLVLIGEKYWARLSWRKWLRAPSWVWAALSLVAWGTALGAHVQRTRPDANGMDATRIDGRRATQEWGALGIGTSVLGNRLSVSNRVFSKGFGTHAASRITLPIPETATTFTSLTGMDDEAFGEAEFSIVVDGQSVWHSGLMKKGDAVHSASVDVRGKRILELVVDPHGVNYGDHADWLEPRFQLKQ